MPKLRRARDATRQNREVRWRCDYLTRAGFDKALAKAIAADPRWDLHALLELRERGCPPALAARILDPVDAQEPRP
jgi:hypothetical protein